MSRRVRMSSGLVLLLVMLGLPVAPVLCELACPQTAVQAATTTPSRHVLTSTARVAPCHEASAAQADEPLTAVAAADVAASTLESGNLNSTEHRGCEHPPVLTSPRANEGLRVPAPALVAAESSQHLSPSAAAPAVVATLAAARALSRPPAAPFSPVLRI